MKLLEDKERFNEINDLKKGLEYGKYLIRKCNNELKVSAANASFNNNNVESNNTE